MPVHLSSFVSPADTHFYMFWFAGTYLLVYRCVFDDLRCLLVHVVCMFICVIHRSLSAHFTSTAAQWRIHESCVIEPWIVTCLPILSYPVFCAIALVPSLIPHCSCPVFCAIALVPSLIPHCSCPVFCAIALVPSLIPHRSRLVSHTPSLLPCLLPRLSCPVSLMPHLSPRLLVPCLHLSLSCPSRITLLSVISSIKLFIHIVCCTRGYTPHGCGYGSESVIPVVKPVPPARVQVWV